ncbi:EutN/CcmL family microcompartment protein [Chloroflexota bacterium]
MYVGRVAGTVVATIKNELFEGHKLLLVDRLPLPVLGAGSPEAILRASIEQGAPSTEDYDIAVDMVQAGVGDLVIVLDEGNSARQILDREPLGAIRALVVGIVDEITITDSALGIEEPRSSVETQIERVEP